MQASSVATVAFVGSALWTWSFLTRQPSHEADIIDVLRQQLNRCGPEHLVCPACPTCQQCTPVLSVVLGTVAGLVLVVFAARGLFRLAWAGRQQESVPFIASTSPSEVSRRRPLPAGAFNASQADFDGAWEQSLQVRDRSVRGNSSARSGDVVTPSTLRK